MDAVFIFLFRGHTSHDPLAKSALAFPLRSSGYQLLSMPDFSFYR